MYFREIFREHSELLLSLVSNQDRQSSFRRSRLTTYNLLQLPVARMTNLARKFASLCLKLGDVGLQKYNFQAPHQNTAIVYMYVVLQNVEEYKLLDNQLKCWEKLRKEAEKTLSRAQDTDQFWKSLKPKVAVR